MNAARISVVHADITTLEVDAIVNAANSRLIPGGGVDGAINKVAGPGLGKAMMAIGRCPTGQAVITPGFKLKARYVVHTVAPVFSQHKGSDVWRLLADCYRNSLELATENAARSVAFPSLGTGVYGIPIKRASAVAVGVARLCLEESSTIERIIFCCFSAADTERYSEAMEAGGAA